MKVVTENINSAKRTEWLKRIMEIRGTECVEGDKICLSFGDISVDSIAPEHIVSLACLVEFLDRKNISVALDRKTECGEYFYTELNMKEYWINRQDYFPARNDTILNLWHVKGEQIEEHARRITDYLKNRYLKNKDLSAVTNSLHEAYYNISDHARAEANAFSMISFNKKTEVLNVAVCDFGIGIARSVRDFDSSIDDDKIALKKAAEANFTVRSAEHNAGMGLYNIRCVCTEEDCLWIISNSAALRLTSTNERATDLGFDFNGSLLTYSVSLSHFIDEETLEDFNWSLEE